MFFAMNCQQVGMVHASTGKAAFITALYIIFVPIFGLFVKKNPPIPVWVGAVIAVVGFYLLNITASEGFGLSEGIAYPVGIAFALALAVTYAIKLGKGLKKSVQ